MAASKPYHKYVFDAKNRKFIGAFEKMYKNEDIGLYDSWFQEDLNSFEKRLSLAVLGQHNFSSILDVGCGKGAFTHMLKKANNRVVGVDISQTAILKAKSKYTGIEFRKSGVSGALLLQKKWDLVIFMEILSYLADWKSVLAKAAKKSRYVYISLYLPPNPIGFVKSFSDLKSEVSRHFAIRTEILYDNDTMFLLAESKCR